MVLRVSSDFFNLHLSWSREGSACEISSLLTHKPPPVFLEYTDGLKRHRTVGTVDSFSKTRELSPRPSSILSFTLNSCSLLSRHWTHLPTGEESILTSTQLFTVTPIHYYLGFLHPFWTERFPILKERTLPSRIVSDSSEWSFQWQEWVDSNVWL